MNTQAYVPILPLTFIEVGYTWFLCIPKYLSNSGQPTAYDICTLRKYILRMKDTKIKYSYLGLAHTNKSRWISVEKAKQVLRIVFYSQDYLTQTQWYCQPAKKTLTPFVLVTQYCVSTLSKQMTYNLPSSLLIEHGNSKYELAKQSGASES